MAIRTYKETLAVNGTGRQYVVQGNPNEGHLEPITVTLTGDFNGATCTLYASVPTSPLDYAPVSNGAFTAVGAHNLLLLPGVFFKFVNSGSGSPQASIKYAVTGEIKINA